MPFFNKKILTLLLLWGANLHLLAQSATSNPPIEMADALYQSGKIYVVITVIAVIFIGIVVYLALLDKKIGKLENELKKNNN